MCYNHIVTTIGIDNDFVCPVVYDGGGCAIRVVDELVRSVVNHCAGGTIRLGYNLVCSVVCHSCRSPVGVVYDFVCSVVNDGCCTTLGIGHNGVCATLYDIHHLTIRVACGRLLVYICTRCGSKVDCSGTTNCGSTHNKQRKDHLAGGRSYCQEGD